MNVTVAVPFVGSLPQPFVHSLMSLQRPQGNTLWVANTPVDLARNKLVADFLGHCPDSDALFFMDSDMTFHPEALARLLWWMFDNDEGKQVDIVSGLYYARTENGVPHAYKFNQRKFDMNWYEPIVVDVLEWSHKHAVELLEHEPATVISARDGLMKVDAVGAGCLLIRRQVLEHLYEVSDGRPFRNHVESKGGEDFNFCELARNNGYDIWLDMAVQCNHMATGFMGRPDFFSIYRFGHDDEYRGRVVVAEGGNLEASGDEWSWAKHVEGYMEMDELYWLALQADRVPDGVIVELGVYKGRSALALMKAGKPIYLVDHFEGEPSDGHHKAHTDHLLGQYKEALEHNLERFAPADADYVILEGDTDIIGREWPFKANVALLHIDAGHDYLEVSEDFDAWKHHVMPGGIVIFHDRGRPGVAKVIREAEDEGWVTIGTQNLLCAMKRKDEVDA